MSFFLTQITNSQRLLICCFHNLASFKICSYFFERYICYTWLSDWSCIFC